MGIYDAALKQEEQSSARNDLIAGKTIHEFTEYIGQNLLELFPEDILKSRNISVLYYLKWFLTTYSPKHLPILFYFLKENGYNMKGELIDSAKLLAKSRASEYDWDLREYVMKSPVIDDIEFNKNGEIRLCSDEIGDFTFKSMYSYWNDNQEIMAFLAKYEIDTFCHQLSWALSGMIPENNLITSKLPSYFEGNYFHTYLKLIEDGLIFDPASYIVSSEENHRRIFAPNVISEINGQQKDFLYHKLVDESTLSKSEMDMPKSLLLAVSNSQQGVRL